jgi:hypothetical protein
VSNDVPVSLPVTKLADKVGVALGSWPAAPPASDLDPEPARPVAAGTANP